MPYVITTRNEHVGVSAQYRNMRGAFVVDRTTVATLDEARELAYDRVVHTPEYTKVTGFPTLEWVNRRLPGTIGPLPDGTVIEVRPDNTHNV